MRELEQQGSSRKDKEEAPQKIVDRKGQEGPREMGRIVEGVRRVHGSLAWRKRETISDEGDADARLEEDSDFEWYVVM